MDIVVFLTNSYSFHILSSCSTLLLLLYMSFSDVCLSFGGPASWVNVLRSFVNEGPEIFKLTKSDFEGLSGPPRPQMSSKIRIRSAMYEIFSLSPPTLSSPCKVGWERAKLEVNRTAAFQSRALMHSSRKYLTESKLRLTPDCTHEMKNAAA